MLKLFNVCVRMASTNKNKKSLSSKLAKQGRVIKPTSIIMKQELRDIEDLPGTASSLFSPIQTRHQRLIKKEPNVNLPAKRAAPKKDSKISKIKMGSATIIKCEVVPQSELMKDLIKVEPAAIKTELTEIKVKVEGNESPAPNEQWGEHLANIRLMRSIKPAPVDTLGCHQCADNNADEKTQRFQKLVALMLSSQTKDETTFEAMKRLKAHGCTPASIQEIPVADLEKLLHPVSFYKNKAKYLKQTSQLLLDKYAADIPDNIKELLKLPGVGPKMAHICMASAWQQITGIGVDTHVHRISNRLNWVKKPTKEPEQTRIQLESWLPHSLWAEVNHLLVGFGQTICTPVKPNCAECLNRYICPSSTAKKN
ncbi:endonuclease III-like protein 1 [Drosophila busckii]|nr:endonuclease III-like protein 1 [Drosophila busckii]